MWNYIESWFNAFGGWGSGLISWLYTLVSQINFDGIKDFAGYILSWFWGYIMSLPGGSAMVTALYDLGTFLGTPWVWAGMRLVWWFVDQFMYAWVVLGGITLMITAWWTALQFRLAVWVYVKIWGST